MFTVKYMALTLKVFASFPFTFLSHCYKVGCHFLAKAIKGCMSIVNTHDKSLSGMCLKNHDFQEVIS